MKLTGQQFKQLQEALLDAFRVRHELWTFVRYKFDLNLDAIVGSSTLTEVVNGLITWAESEDRVEEFIAKAREEKPGNEALRAFAEQLRQVTATDRLEAGEEERMDEKTAIPAGDSGERSGGVTFQDNAEVHGDVAGRDIIKSNTFNVHVEEVHGDKVEGDKIEGHIGDVGPGAQVVIGKDINQTIAQAPMKFTTAECVELEHLLAELKNQLARLDIPVNKKAVGEEFVGQLEKELTRTDAPPDASIMKVAGNWLLENIPTLTGTLASVFLNPVVGKVVEAAGDIAAEWVKERFGAQA